jgi:hypothetical protein
MSLAEFEAGASQLEADANTNLAAYARRVRAGDIVLESDRLTIADALVRLAAFLRLVVPYLPRRPDNGVFDDYQAEMISLDVADVNLVDYARRLRRGDAMGRTTRVQIANDLESLAVTVRHHVLPFLSEALRETQHRQSGEAGTSPDTIEHGGSLQDAEGVGEDVADTDNSEIGADDVEGPQSPEEWNALLRDIFASLMNAMQLMDYAAEELGVARKKIPKSIEQARTELAEAAREQHLLALRLAAGLGLDLSTPAILEALSDPPPRDERGEGPMV